MASADVFMHDLLNVLGRMAYQRARPIIPSQTLQRALRVVSEHQRAAGPRVRLHIPHYWAPYLHDGRGAIMAPMRNPGERDGYITTFLVWFTDPSDDPRLPLPERYRDVRRLTPEEFREGLRINRARRAAGAPPFMRYEAGSLPPMEGKFFFDNSRGMAGFPEEAKAIIRARWRNWALNSMRRALGVRSFVPARDSPLGIDLGVEKDVASAVLG